jgi:hypothetical protein
VRNIRQTWQKLQEAMDVLATGPGRVQERLAWAAMSLAVLEREDFEEVRQREMLIEFMNAMTVSHDKTLGSFTASAMAMTDGEASRWARKLVDTLNEATTALRARWEHSGGYQRRGTRSVACLLLGGTVARVIPETPGLLVANGRSRRTSAHTETAFGAWHRTRSANQPMLGRGNCHRQDR